MTSPRPAFHRRPPFRTLVERVAAAIRDRTGFSLVRLGEGEGPVLCWPQAQRPDELAGVLHTWFGRSDLDDAALDTIADGLRRAVASADVLGLPTRFQLGLTARYGMVLDAVARHRLHRPGQVFADNALHWYLQWSGALRHLLHGLDRVDAITCRELGPALAEAFALGSVHTHLVRGETGHPGPLALPHWPDGFERLMRGLDAVEPGRVFLVGAGVLGKIYCDRIKANGGVALDVGSLFDCWAGVPSRARYRLGAAEFTLAHFRSCPADWPGMTAELVRCHAAFHARDATVTL